MAERFRIDRQGTILEWMTDELHGRSRTNLKECLTNGRVLVNDRPVRRHDHRINPGDSVCILSKGEILSRSVSGSRPDNGVKIIYEDEWLVIVAKKEGIPTVSTGKYMEKTVHSVLSDYVRRSGHGTQVFVVHRIDRDTSGVLVFAKDHRTKELLQENWNDSVLERKYVAVLEGFPGPVGAKNVILKGDAGEGTVTSWLLEHPKSLKVSSSPVDNGGKKAITHYHVLKAGGKYCLAEFELETGRKNQIRIHASAMGCPIAGDKKYGAVTDPFRRLALHAMSLSFVHPVTGKTLSFSVPVPKVFMDI